MKYLFVYWLLVALCKLKNTHAKCWDTSCQQDSWAVRGCQQYGMIESDRKSCPNGTIFSCCLGNQTSTSTNRISQECLDTGPNQFECASGSCINQKFACDGIRDCDDGTDETIKNCDNNKCSENQFRCGYGACIDLKLKCDGVMHCLDGSDELSELCKAKPTTPPPKPTPSRSKRSSPFESCTLPPNSPDKEFTVQCPYNINCERQPGNKVPQYTEVHFTCNPGYQSDGGKSFDSICAHTEKWIPEIANCSKICSTLKPKNVELKCIRKKTEVDCNGTLVDGTTVSSRCKRHHRINYPVPYSDITCQANGEWTNPLVSCEPECGKPSADLKKLIVYGELEKYGNSPWHVAVYDISKKNKPLICGGTIISRYLVVSAAHCFFDEDIQKEQAPDRFEIVVSKITRNYYTKDNKLVKHYKVRKIFFPPGGFTGRTTNYESDIVIIWLTESISLTALVMPACIHWTNDDSTKIMGNLQGKLVGWGRDENGELSEFLQTANLTLTSYKDCIRTIPSDVKSLLTIDKFCAGLKTGPGAREGDSGGGLMFYDPNSDVYYLEGIVSVKEASETSVAAFTNVAEYIKWMNEIKKQVEQEVRNENTRTNHVVFRHDAMWNSSSTINLYTDDEFKYKHFYPVTSNEFAFRVKARNDVHILLTTTPYESLPSYEIVLGGWWNTQSVMRRNRLDPFLVDAKTPHILNETEFKGFWIKWEDDNILVGMGDDSNTFLRYHDTQLYPVKYFGVTTGFTSTGHWIIYPIRNPSLPLEAMWNSTSTFNLYTDEEFNYKNFYPVTSNNLSFRVKARNDVHILLTTTPHESSPSYEIVLGGWWNGKSVIRKNRREPSYVEADTPKILNETQYKGFWIRWEKGIISVGTEGSSNPFLKYQDKQSFAIKFFAVTTGFQSTGHWIIDL